MVDGDKRKRSESRRGGTKKSLWAIDVQIQNVVLGFSPLPNQKTDKKKRSIQGEKQEEKEKDKLLESVECHEKRSKEVEESKVEEEQEETKEVWSKEKEEEEEKEKEEEEKEEEEKEKDKL